MWLMIGYFFDESSDLGAYISPYRSVLPSRAFTVIGIGAFQPLATSREMSAFSSVVMTFPSASRRTVTGATFGCAYESTTYLPVGESSIVWSPSSGVSTAKREPSMFTRQSCLKYG